MKIIEMHCGLWKEEESFKVTNSDAKIRPVYLSLQDHIDAHFLTCFIFLVIVKIFEKRMEGKYSVATMLKSLSKGSFSHIQENYYLFYCYKDLLAYIGKELGMDFGKKSM